MNRLTYDDHGFAVIESAVRSVLDRALAEGLVTVAEGHDYEVAVKPANGYVGRHVTVETSFDWPRPPYAVAEGREQELQERLRTAVSEALDPARPLAR